MNSRKTSSEELVAGLLASLHQASNRRDAKGMAALFTDDGSMVGFDGSIVEGSRAIEGHLAPIFRDHPTAAFVGKVREVRMFGRDVALVRAIAGMVPPGKDELTPKRNVIQSVVAVRDRDRWRVAHFQNTPAAFHGRPELVQQMTAELTEVLRSRGMTEGRS